MRTHQTSQKKSSPQNTFAPTANPLESRPFAAQRKPEEITQPQETKGYKSQIPEFSILNPEGERQPVQPKLAIQRREEQSETLQAKPENTLLQRQAELKTPNQTGLPNNLKAGVENLSGYSLDNVRVHYNSPKPAQLQALAYTQGTDIHVAPGQEQHLPHEAWHVVQQMQGRVKPTMQMKGLQINENEALEREADEMGREALKKRSDVFSQQKTYELRSWDVRQTKAIPEPEPETKEANTTAVIQGIWDTTQPQKHKLVALIEPALQVFTSGVMFTRGSGVALYRLAQRQEEKLVIEFCTIEEENGTGGDTQLLFMDNSSVIGHQTDTDLVVLRDDQLAKRATQEGLKIRININMNSEINSTTGGIINTLVHEFAVHAVDYYPLLKALLEASSEEEKQKAVDQFKQEEGVGKPPIKKLLINALSNKDEVETQKSLEQHQQLAKGGTDYYKAIVQQISDVELNTIYHNWLKSNRNDFIKAQKEDVEGHQIGYDKDVFIEEITKLIKLGTPIEELTEKSNALSQWAEKWK
ncbi:MAG: DUF4157 domain-containing protein [Nostoc sp. TH1S01]|nr:DUF4157 domain-containing protein [Nostoc sp. TH1S01]